MIHESAHFFVETLTRIADSGGLEALTADLNTLRRHAGLPEGADWTVDAHETVARSFEAYMREGRAPDPELAGVFARIRGWLLELYRSVRDLDVDWPGYMTLRLTDRELGSLAPNWQANLKPANGVYLLSCTQTGEQYVGAAFGADGFSGRWAAVPSV